MRKTRRIRNDAFILIAVYAAMVLLRAILAISTHIYPTVLIDEMLYYNIARSIANGEGLRFMGQTADYATILYSLVLSPVYMLFGEGAPFWKIMQGWNSVLINLTVFPVYALAKRVTGSRASALVTAVITVILPDMCLSGYIMSENIIYPMFFAMMYCAYRYLEDERPAHILLVGLLGGLIYFTKPGHVVPAVVILLIALIMAAKNRDAKAVGKALAGAGVLAAVIAALYALVYIGFGHSAAMLGVYEAQIASAESLNLGIFFKSLALYPFYFAIICGGACFLLPLMRYSELSARNRVLLNIVLLSLAGTMIGTAWIVNRVETANPTIHTRYVAMYVPVLLMLTMSGFSRSELEIRRDKTVINRASFVGSIFVLYMALCGIVLGSKAGIYNDAPTAMNPGVAILKDEVIPANMELAATIVIIALAALMVWLLPRVKFANARRISVGALAVLCLFNTFAVQDYMERTPSVGVYEDGMQLNEMLAGEEQLYVYADYSYICDAAADANSDKGIPMVYINDLFNKTVESEGVYEPFVPSAQRGTVADSLTPDCRYIAMDKDAYGHLELADGVQATATDNGSMYLIELPEEGRWVDSIMGGPIRTLLQQGKACVIADFDETRKGVPVTLSIHMDLHEDSTVVVSVNDKRISFELPAGEDTYKIDFPDSADKYIVTIENCDANIYGYELITQ